MAISDVHPVTGLIIDDNWQSLVSYFFTYESGFPGHIMCMLDAHILHLGPSRRRTIQERMGRVRG